MSSIPESTIAPERTNADAVAGLRACADFLEANPDLPQVHFTQVCVAWLHGQDARVRLGQLAVALAPCDKQASDYYYDVARNFGPVRLFARADRDVVCERVEVGTRTVKVLDLPDDVRAQYEVEVEEQIFETRCPPSLLRSVSADAQAETHETVA